MEKHLIALKLCFFGFVAVSGCVTSHAQAEASLTSECSFSISIQKANEFADNQMAEYAKRSETFLADVQAIKSRMQRPDVIVPGVPKGEMLGRADIENLSELRRKFASISAETNIVSNYKRDVQVIEETYRVAKLADLHGVSKEDLADADPRKFYFEILERLRVSQPSAPQTPQLRQDSNCDPEAGLYSEEKIYRQRLGKTGDVKQLVNLISDIERLRTLYDLYRNLLTKGIADVRATTWSGEVPSSPSSIPSYVAASDAAIQSMYKTIVPYIDQQFPSDGSFEQTFQIRSA